MKTRTTLIASVLLLTAFTIVSPAQKGGAWASARDRGLKGSVRTLINTCTDSSGKYVTTLKYEFAPDGQLVTIHAPQFPHYDCILTTPMSQKITKRNRNGDPEQFDRFVAGDVFERERYEYEYDSVGNWTKQVTYLMHNYSQEGSDWKEGEWRRTYVCTRQFDYYR
jgi:hypothetical protein